MLELPLEPTDDLSRPAFKDKSSCEIWLQQLQLTNLHQAHGALRFQLEEFNRFPIKGLERLNTLELYCETLVAVQEDYAKKLISKRLPFSDEEMTIFVAIISMWQNMVTGYQRCLQAFLAGDKQLEQSGALLTQRCMRYIGLQIFEHQRNSYDCNPHLWQQLHALYAFAEENNFQLTKVADELHSLNHPGTCQNVWVKTLLASHGHPDQLTRGQLKMLDRWLNNWSDVIEVDRRYDLNEEEAQTLAADLWSSQGLQNVKIISTSGEMRYLAMMPLSKLLRVKTILLDQGQSPQQLELGEYSKADCLDFLNKLHQYLCDVNFHRQTERKPVAQAADLCFSIEGIYAHISLKPFRPPKQEVGSDRLGQKQIAAFGRVLTDTNRQQIMQMGYAFESWLIENESPLGVKVLREDRQGERIGVHQLVAVQPRETNTFLIGKVSWIAVTLSGQLRMGIQYFPGIAEPISIQNKGLNNILTDKAVAALLLPAVPELKTPASLIVPRDFFRANHFAEVTNLDGKIQIVKLGFSVLKGSDFERISFTLN
jgi:hypothetical protein